MLPVIEVVHADITTLAVDAIVNAANEPLLGYPKAAAAEIAISTIRGSETPVERVVLCAFSPPTSTGTARCSEPGLPS